MTGGRLKFAMEVGAISLGEEAYRMESADWLKGMHEQCKDKSGKWRPGVGLGDSRNYKAISDLFVTNVFRAWRTYGVNSGLFCQVRRIFEMPPGVTGTPASPERDPRRPGATPDKTFSMRNCLGTGKIGPLGGAYMRALSPLMAYIGGSDGEFTLKDKAYYAGEMVRKSLVIINNKMIDVDIEESWELCDSGGKTIAKGKFDKISMTPGEIAPDKYHIEFKAPEADKRSEFIIKVNGKASIDGVLDDEFKIVVFPKPPKPQVPQGLNIYLFDPLGDTAKMLDKAGVAYKLLEGSLPDPENSLYIIGRNALKDEENRKKFGKLRWMKMGYDYIATTSLGMRTLVFEQASDNIWGLQAEETRWRRAFISAPGHPVFDGLAKGDFVYLKGHSDLVEAYPDAGEPSLVRMNKERFPEWGNDNSVVTYSIERPQSGASRSLLVCGFDLKETALMESAAGKGRIMFCQVDVTDRYGTDPVSTLLVNNIISYMASAPQPSPAAGKPVDLVRIGDEDYDIDMTEEENVIANKPDGPISWGITLADLYFQDILKLPAIKGKDGKGYLFAKIDGEKHILHTLNRRKFLTPWQKKKVMIIRSALLMNQGGSAEIFPNPGLQDNSEELYPFEWIQGFVHPYLLTQW